MPLLHIWSLAVEEQFYLLFPIVMLLIAKFGRTRYTAWLLGPVPEIGYDVPSATYVASMTDRDVDALIAPSLSDHESRNSEIMGIFEAIRSSTAAPTILQPSEYLCDQGVCRVAIEDAPLYLDDNHLSTFGSHYLSPMFDEVFGQLAPRLVSVDSRADDAPDSSEDFTVE